MFALGAGSAFGFACHVHTVAAWGIGALAQPVGKGQGFLFKHVLRAQAHRVDQHGQHAIQHGALLVGFAVPGATAGQCTAQQFAGHGHAKTFVVAKGHECAKQTVGLRHHHHAGVGGGVTMFVNQIAGRYLLALVVGHAHLALCHAAGGKVQHKGCAAAHGHADAAGVGAKAPIATAKRRDHGA